MTASSCCRWLLALCVVARQSPADASQQTKSALWAFASGALSAYAIWYKYPFALFIGVVVFAYLWCAYDRAPLAGVTSSLSPSAAC